MLFLHEWTMKMFPTKCENKASDLLLWQENLRKGTIHSKMLYLFAPNFLLVNCQRELGLFFLVETIHSSLRFGKFKTT